MDYIIIISNAKVKRAGTKPVIQCIFNAEQHMGNQVTGLVTSSSRRLLGQNGATRPTSAHILTLTLLY